MTRQQRWNQLSFLQKYVLRRIAESHHAIATRAEIEHWNAPGIPAMPSRTIQSLIRRHYIRSTPLLGRAHLVIYYATDLGLDVIPPMELSPSA